MNQIIDEVYLNGVLSGILLGVAGIWVLWLVNALWRASLRPYAEALPFEMRPSGWRPRFRGAGVVGDRAVEVELRGGLGGLVALVDEPDTTRRIPLDDVDPAGWLDQLSD